MDCADKHSVRFDVDLLINGAHEGLFYVFGSGSKLRCREFLSVY